jgi:hypothetical protein
MNISFKTGKGLVEYSEETVNHQDPTSQITISITRNDGIVFKLVNFWDWQFLQMFGDHECINCKDDNEVRSLLRKHSLPSFDYIMKKVLEIQESYEEDPMTIALGGMNSII